MLFSIKFHNGFIKNLIKSNNIEKQKLILKKDFLDISKNYFYLNIILKKNLIII